MSLHALVGHELALVLRDPLFAITEASGYRNGNGRPGLRITGVIGSTLLYIAQSHTTGLPSLDMFKRVLSNPIYLDHNKSIIYYAGHRLGYGIRIEAWCQGRWYHIFVPLLRGIHQHGSIARILQLMNM
jgi:hypothetical protein